MKTQVAKITFRLDGTHDGGLQGAGDRCDASGGRQRQERSGGARRRRAESAIRN